MINWSAPVLPCLRQSRTVLLLMTSVHCTSDADKQGGSQYAMMILLLLLVIMPKEILTRLKRPILLLCQTAASPLWDRYENANANNNVNDGDNV